MDARLRKMRANKDEVLLMYCNMETGHGGASADLKRSKRPLNMPFS